MGGTQGGHTARVGRLVRGLAVAAALAGAAAGFGCASCPCGAGAGGGQALDVHSLDQVAGDPWKLLALQVEGRAVAIDPAAVPTLAVDDTGRVSGLATLNRYFGQLALGPGGAVSWAEPGFGSTMMAGPQELMDQEQRFLAGLRSASHASLEGGRLVLRSAAGDTRLEFAR